MNESKRPDGCRDEEIEAMLRNLSTLSFRKAPGDFVLQTKLRFEAAMAAKQRRRMAIVTAVGFVLTSSLAWILVLNVGGARDLVVASLVEWVTLMGLLLKSWIAAPVYTTIFGIVLCMMLFLFSGLLGKLHQAPEQVK